MSNKLMTLVWSNQTENLSLTEVAILVKLADISSDDGTGIWPSISTIAQATKAARRTVIKTLKALGGKGYLIKRSRFIKGNQTSNEYFLNARRLWDESDKKPPPTPRTDLFNDDEVRSEINKTHETDEETGVHEVHQVVNDVHPNPPLTFLQTKQQHRAYARSGAAADAKAFVAVLQEAEKRKGYIPEATSPLDEVRGEVALSSEIDEIDNREPAEQLVDELILLGLLKVRAMALVQSHGFSRVTEAILYAKAKATDNPAAYLEKTLLNGWGIGFTPIKGVKAEPSLHARRELQETQKVIDKTKQWEREKETPQAKKAASEGMQTIGQILAKAKIANRTALR